MGVETNKRNLGGTILYTILGISGRWRPTTTGACTSPCCLLPSVPCTRPFFLRSCDGLRDVRCGDSWNTQGCLNMFELTHDGSMVLLYMVTWIPSIYPLYVSIYTSTMDPMGEMMKCPDFLKCICQLLESSGAWFEILPADVWSRRSTFLTSGLSPS